MTRSHRRLLQGALALIVAVNVVLPLPARATPPPYVPVTSHMPPLPAIDSQHRSPVCRTGGRSCLRRTIAEMQHRVDLLAERCDHNVLFAVTYLRVTQTFAWWITHPRGVRNAAYLQQVDRVFALRYFAAYDNWQSGRRSQVPRAWQTTFAAADRRDVDGPGDVLLAINAHVYEDLPFVLDSLGVVDRDRASHKPDYDLVNEVFVDTIDPLVAELAARFDPEIGVLFAAGEMGPAGFIQLQAAAREEAWREAEELATAPGPVARSIVAGMIHDRAQAHAELILATNRDHPPVTSSAGRDAYCHRHRDDPPPQAYPFGRA